MLGSQVLPWCFRALLGQWLITPSACSPFPEVRHPWGLGSAYRTARISLFQTNTGIRKNLEQEIIHYNFKTSFFDIFVSGLREGAIGGSGGAGMCLWLDSLVPAAHILV